MGVFSFVQKNDNRNVIIQEKVVSDDVFSNIFKLYNTIRERPDNYEEIVEDMLGKISDSQKGFITYALNHYLVYNEFTRNFIDMFTLVSGTFLSNDEYIRFYVRYMIQNKVVFPKYMAWYKIGLYNDTKQYKELLKEKYKLDDDDVVEVLNYFSDKNISIRDICLTIL